MITYYKIIGEYYVMGVDWSKGEYCISATKKTGWHQTMKWLPSPGTPWALHKPENWTRITADEAERLLGFLWEG